MFSEVNSDFLEQKIQEDIEKSFEARIARTKLSRKGDAGNDIILNKNSCVSPTYAEAFRRSIECPEEFWAEVARCVDWSKPWDKVLDNSNEPFTKWYVGGEINACHNAVDRHVNAGYGKKTALIHDSPLIPTIRKVTYDELLEKTSRLAGVLADMGVRKGDRVLIYMPLIPETIMAILATARLGAIHSVVFGGFAPRELAVRIDHAEPKVIIGASCGLEPSRIIKYTTMINEAMELISVPRPKCIIYQRRKVWESPLLDHQEDWEELIENSNPHPCVSVEANDPLYILYTSGTTATPKGVLRPVGGHIATLCWTMKVLYGMDKNNVFWTASDLGWVVGHSYICYGPLLYGGTSLMYEGKPDRTPDAAQYFRLIEQHSVNALLTVPSVLRVLRRADPEALMSKKYSTKSLKVIFTAGEHCDYEAKAWAENVFKVPILNHWWQTETGHAITATCLGFGESTCPPKYTTGMAFPGYDVKIMREDGSLASTHELGRIVVKLPLPPGTMSSLYLAPERFKDIYFSKFPGYYDTMDAGFVDEHGYIYVTARVDDVINVAGHRLSTAALEDVVLGHPDVADTAVVGVPEHTKGEIPLCLYVMRNGTTKSEKTINEELIYRVRQLIGPIASFKIAAAVSALPRTRSGKTCRKSIADLARSRPVKIPSTIEDASVYPNIKAVLQKLGYAKMAPDPEL
ncbi:acyl-CoA synthetase short-chain family member 3, mitochondrial [Venturia canescens]|uniref:acyl-CoA synthetase short-chain family member 3, mitochondrial n=1 Tax=Venturia canescens TaxID=32260 RepID=UPI001C9D158E|nr:acyl-CoA synthetase short-chain family member 3, mitochondrial [Venturia canescens]XP_043282357.1 acyl-CoA synthetase short-chain family member 3, mitochondrial [Venturia canescens]XP_043282358.1 acyl-CoA synthetase short-chain family member 3, mitochondrial [Venturia canescens]